MNKSDFQIAMRQPLLTAAKYSDSIDLLKAEARKSRQPREAIGYKIATVKQLWIDAMNTYSTAFKAYYSH